MSPSEPVDVMMPSSLLLLGVAALAAGIEDAVADGDGVSRLPSDSPAAMLLLGVIAMRAHIDRRLASPSAPTTPSAPSDLRELLR